MFGRRVNLNPQPSKNGESETSNFGVTKLLNSLIILGKIVCLRLTISDRSRADSETRTADSETNGHADSETKTRKLTPRIRKLGFGN